MPLFEVAILETPTIKGAKEGEVEKLVFGPKAVVAKDEDSASVVAVLNAAEELGSVDKDRLDVLVRPFLDLE